MPTPEDQQRLAATLPSRVYEPHEVDIDGHSWHSPSYVGQWIHSRLAGAEDSLTARQSANLAVLFDLLERQERSTLRVLDLGAGWGSWALEILRRIPDAEVVLVDFSVPMLDEAKHRLAFAGDRCRFHQVDLAAEGCLAALLPGYAAAFDAIVSHQVIHHLRRRRLAGLYSEMATLLAPAGFFLGIDRVHRPYRRMFDRLGTRGKKRYRQTQYAATRREHLRFLKDAGLQAIASSGYTSTIVARHRDAG